MTSTASLLVAAAGPLVSVQDRGRPGHLRHGVSGSGPVDRLAHAVANVAVGNSEGAPAFEISRGGVAVECAGAPVTVAVAGGGFSVALDGHERVPWSVVTLTPGSRLTVSQGDWGSWAYLAVAGTLRAERWLDSAATHSTSGLGGGIVTTGSRWEIDEPRAAPGLDGPIGVPDLARPLGVVRVVLGPQHDRFAPEAVDRLVGATFRLTDASDRMGVRLDGPELPLADALSIPSEAILRGSIQVAGDGVATLLLADHQPTGGYPKIAVVVDADVDRAAQLRPGDALRFHVVEPDEAVASTRHLAQARLGLLADVGRSDRTLEQRLRQRNLVDGVYGTD